MWLTVIVIINVLALWIYYKIIKPYKHWEEKRVPYLKPIPIIGSMGPLLIGKQSFANLLQNIYNSRPEWSYICFYQFFQNTVLLRDPDLIKQVTIKDFDAFPEYQTFVPEGLDPFWDKNLLGMKGGPKWQALRTFFTPSFTGNKMKMMFDLMKSCSQRYINFFENQHGIIEIEGKDVFSRYSNDVLASIAFGVTCNSLENPNNEFYMMGKELTDFSGLRRLLFFVCPLGPTFMKFLKIHIVNPKYVTFFKKFVNETIKVREEQGITRPDFIELLIEARKGRLEHDDQGVADVNESELGKTFKSEITSEDITAQALIIYLAGFDPSSTLMSFTFYELAINLDIQERLRDEILTTLKSCQGDVTYEALLGMKYLDMVISESLRKWPPVEMTDRNCTKNVTFESKRPEEKSLHLDINTACWIPIYAIHRDPQYYPNPDQFDPERFNKENKKYIKPCTYLPFSIGPRSCIGIRLVLLKTKLIIFEILSKFEIVPIEKTQIPLTLKKGGVNMITEKGTWVGLKLRKSELI